MIVILSNNLVKSIVNDLNPSLESVNYIKYGLDEDLDHIAIYALRFKIVKWLV